MRMDTANSEKQTMLTVMTNGLWDDRQQVPPRISVITPLYNREKTIERTIRSVFAQTCQDFEYIIVDDGSDDGGGMIGRRYLEPEALNEALLAWDSIPEDKKSQYREVVGLCRDAVTGEILGSLFPDHINEVPWNRALKMCKSCHGEHIGVHRAEILKENLWPEPEGVQDIAHSLLWDKLAQKYRFYYINSVLRTYHLEAEDSMKNSWASAHPLQAAISHRWCAMYRLNHIAEYQTSTRKHWKYLMDYTKADCRIDKLDPEYVRPDTKLTHPADRFGYTILRGLAKMVLFVRDRIGTRRAGGSG